MNQEPKSLKMLEAVPHFRLEPLNAAKAMRRLLADKDDTAQVFEIIRALSGRSTPKGYMRLLTTTEGARQAYRADELASKLDDKAWLSQFTLGSVGAAYREFLAPRGFSAAGLNREAEKAQRSTFPQEHPYSWFGRRKRDVHDIWHVLTGYGTDALGEACLVAFSYAQTHDLGFAFIAVGAAVKFSRSGEGFPYARAIFEAYRRGRRSAWLPQEDYEKVLREDLGVARKRLNIEPAPIYTSIPADHRDSSFALKAAE